MTTTTSVFTHAQDSDFSIAQNVEKMHQALQKTAQQLGDTYPAVINGQRIFSQQLLISTNPANPQEIIGKIAKVSQLQAEEALQGALAAFTTWSATSVETRTNVLFKAAEIIEERRFELAALMVLEAGKNFTEADAEVSEAVDFLNYYAYAALKLAQDDHDLVRIPTEDNHLTYIALGVGFIVPPWNFPFAITTGLTVSALVMGNTALLKPSSLTPIIAYRLVSILEEAGLPPGVLQFIPGDASDIGDYLTGHPQMRFVSFTGSKEVGLHINALAAQTAPGQKWIKRVNAEMGGKDGIVVDETTDLRVAADEIIQAAFSFQGQKCSAGSRVIVVESVHDALVEEIITRVQLLTCGDGKDNCDIGPVIDKKAYETILRYIDIGKKEGTLVYGGKPMQRDGYFIEPTIITNNTAKSTIMQEEIFGPVLAIAKATDWQHAIEMYNDTEYGLTGSFFSKDEERIAYAEQYMHCGNLYINRRCTGALVGVHPFGGFNMSGTDSKAGSYDYLKLFSQGKLITKRK